MILTMMIEATVKVYFNCAGLDLELLNRPLMIPLKVPANDARWVPAEVVAYPTTLAPARKFWHIRHRGMLKVRC